MLFLISTLVLFGCSNNPDAFEVLERSQQAHLEANVMSMTGGIEFEITRDMGFMTLSSPVTVEIQIENMSRFRMEMGTSEFTSVNFFRDGHQYIAEIELDQIHQSRLVAPDSDVLANNELMQLLSVENLMAISRDRVESYSAESFETGGYRLEFIHTLDGMMTFIDGSIFLPGVEGIAYLMNDEDVNVSEYSMVTIIYIGEDDLPVSVVSNLLLTVATEEDGIETEVTLDMTTTLTTAPVTIDFPDWLDELDPTVDPDELVGTWEWDIGGLVYIFNADGTGMRGFADIELLDFEWKIVNDYHLYLDFDSHTERWLVSLNDDIIMITDLDDASSVSFNYHRVADFVQVEDESINRALLPISNVYEIVGEWEFMGTPWLRFYEDGRAIDLSNDNEFTWNADGTFEGARQQETWFIEDDVLTVFWTSGAEFTYTRVNQ